MEATADEAGPTHVRGAVVGAVQHRRRQVKATPPSCCSRSDARRLRCTVGRPQSDRCNRNGTPDAKDVRPVYVSAGHLIDLQHSVEFVLKCCTHYRLPETTHWAHKVAGGERLPTEVGLARGGRRGAPCRLSRDSLPPSLEDAVHHGHHHQG